MYNITNFLADIYLISPDFYSFHPKYLIILNYGNTCKVIARFEKRDGKFIFERRGTQAENLTRYLFNIAPEKEYHTINNLISDVYCDILNPCVTDLFIKTHTFRA